MASPQLENGYTKISNELLEALMTVKMSGSEWQYVMCLFRKTYGYNQKEAWVKNAYVCLATGLCKERVSETKKKLLARKIVTEKRNFISLNKNYEEWIELRKNVTVVTEKRNNLLRKSVSIKEKKETIIKDKPKGMYTYQPVDESGSPYRKKAKSNKLSSAPKEVIALAFFFETESEKVTGVKPDLTKAFFKIKLAMKTHGLTSADVKELFKHFLTDKKIPMETKVSLGFPLSGNYIAQWKVKKNNRPISQVEASLDIKL